MNIGRRSFVALAGTAFVSTTLFGCTSPSSSSKEQAPADNATQPDPLVVTTDKGVVRGALEDGVRVFRGIPFAEPPLGELRFAAPREALAWEGECACLECKEPPLQLDDGTVIGSEDCLYLNLWAPQDASAKNLPVFVFIHGGGYSQGSPSKDMHKGTRFAQDGVVQVNITYRLNGLGFFGSSELEKETGLFGNAGMLDQIAGLEWVQRNIAQFGGDPDNITIGGESAGAFSVSTLIASPRAQGLFKRAILESGNLLGQPIVAPAVPGDVEKAESMTASLMATLKAKNLSDMRALEARDIVAQSSFSMDVIHPSERYFWPVFDGTTLPENPYKALQQGKMNNVPILAGFNTDEGSFFVPQGISEQDYFAYMNDVFGDSATAVLERYPLDADNTPESRAEHIFKMGLRLGNDLFAEELSRQGTDVYFYNFDYSLQALQDAGFGVGHGLEMPFIFDSIPNSVQITPELKSMKDMIHSYWLNFIKTGNPNGEGLATWSKYTEAHKETMRLDVDSNLISSPEQEEVAFYRDLFWA